MVRAAVANGRHVAVCGEAAADPVLMPVLIGLGVEELSVGPASIPTVRARLTELDLAQCRALAVRALAASSVAEVQAIAAEATVGTDGSRSGAARRDRVAEAS